MSFSVKRGRSVEKCLVSFFIVSLFFVTFISSALAKTTVSAKPVTPAEKGKSDYITIKHRAVKDILKDADHLYSIGKYEEALALYNYISDITKGEYLGGEDFISKKKKEEKKKPKKAKKSRVLKKVKSKKPVVLQKEEPKKPEKPKKLEKPKKIKKLKKVRKPEKVKKPKKIKKLKKPAVLQREEPKKPKKARVLKKSEPPKAIVLPKPKLKVSKPRVGKPEFVVERFVLTEKAQKEIDALYKKAIPYYRGSLALFYHSQEKLDKSKKIFEQILAIDPTQKKARRYIDKKIPARREKIKKRIQKVERRELK